MVLPLQRQAPKATRRADKTISYHAKLWVDGRFGELSAAAYSVGVARARRMGPAKFIQAMAVGETRKAFIGQMTKTAVGLVERTYRMTSRAGDERIALLEEANKIFQVRLGTIAVIAATLASKLGLSLESESAEGRGGFAAFDQTLAELEGETAWGSPLEPPPDHVRPALIRDRPPFPTPRPTTPRPAPKATPPEPSLQVWKPRNERHSDAVEQLRRGMAWQEGKRRGKPSRESEPESGWDLALRRSADARQLSPQHASAARKRIRALAASAFAAALDRAVDANLLARFAARHPGGVDAARLRAAYAETANRAFAREFVALIGGQPPASAEDIALGAIIAVAIAQTTGRYPIVPPERIAPMAVLVHRSLRPQLPQLARMAAVIAAAPTAPARASGPTHELAW